MRDVAEVVDAEGPIPHAFNRSPRDDVPGMIRLLSMRVHFARAREALQLLQ